MMWVIGAALVIGGALFLARYAKRRRDFDYRGRRYSRHSDGTFTYYGDTTISDQSERLEVEVYWNDTHSSSSDGSSGDGGDGGGDGGGGD